jgi:glycogen operon protein
VAELASRLAGSADLYEESGRRPHASINFVTAHDGFTLADLVSYNDKHNDANGEGNNDGDNHNLSWNCGAEGETSDPAVLTLRARQRRNFIATLFLSQGVPMISGGDEIGRTQGGNNNAYCQDNEISWTNWQLTDEQRDFLEFTRRLSGLMHEHRVLRRRKFFHGTRVPTASVRDIMWLAPGGQEMTDAEWNAGHIKCLGVRLSGVGLDDVDDEGRPLTGATLLYLLNASEHLIPFVLPAFEPGISWRVLIDTFDETRQGRAMNGGTEYPLGDHSVVLFVAE